MHCSLYVTDRCNLACGYCHEYDNRKPMPTFEQLRQRVDKVLDLGVSKIAFVGGEPLLHPELGPLIRHARQRGANTSISTNGHLLTAAKIDELAGAGLNGLQLSVDRLTPSAVSRKALSLVEDRIDLLNKAPFKFHLTTVMCADTVGDARAILEWAVARNIHVELRVMHADPGQCFRTTSAEQEDLFALIEEQRRLKAVGRSIHATSTILDFQAAILGRGRFDWTCLAGYKIFFVSGDGKFWLCSHRPTDLDILQVSTADLHGYAGRKGCEPHCGIYCAVNNSVFITSPTRFVAAELGPRFRQAVNMVLGRRQP